MIDHLIGMNNDTETLIMFVITIMATIIVIIRIMFLLLDQLPLLLDGPNLHILPHVHNLQWSNVAIWYPIILSVFPNFTHWSGFPWVQHGRGGGWVPAEGNFRGSPAGLEPWLDHYLRASNHLGLKPWNMWDFSGGFTWLKMTKHIANMIYILNEFWALIGLWIAKPNWQVYPHNQWTIEV